MQETQKKECEEYLRKHQIKALFEDLCTELSYHQPDNVKEFLIKQLKLREERKTHTLPIFNEKEIENIFHLYNLKGDGLLKKNSVKQALRCVAHSEADMSKIDNMDSVGEFIDMNTFKNLAETVLGINM